MSGSVSDGVITKIPVRTQYALRSKFTPAVEYTLEDQQPQPRTSVVTAVGFDPASHLDSETKPRVIKTHSLKPGIQERRRITADSSSSDNDLPNHQAAPTRQGPHIRREYERPWRASSGFKPASIAVFSYPAYRWAATVLKVLEMAGIKSDDPRIQREVLPTLYSRLPAEVQAGMSNIITIEQLLKHVDRFDRPPVNLSDILKNTMLHNALPSTALNVVEEELHLAFPHGMTKEALRTLAWTSLRERLQPPLSTYVQFADIREFPSQYHLDKLDELHLQGERHVVASAQSERLTAIEKSLDKLINLQLRVLEHQDAQGVAAAYTHPTHTSNTINQTHVRSMAVTRTPGGAGDRRGGTRVEFEERAGLAAGRGRLRPCRFHAQFGNQARRCEPPCLFAALLGGLKNGLNSLTEEARQQLRLGADSESMRALQSSSCTLAIEAPK